MRARWLPLALLLCFAAPSALGQVSGGPQACEGRLASAPQSASLRSLTTEPVTPDAVRRCLAAPKSTRREPDSTYVRQEGTISGLRYRFDEWGFAMVPGDTSETHLGDTEWRVRCAIDPMDDSLNCTLTRARLAILRTNLGLQIAVLGRAYPGSEIRIRVDTLMARAAPSNIGFIKGEADSLLAALKAGGRVLIRYEEWPQRNDVTEEQSLRGFAQAMELLERVYAAIQRGRGKS